MHDDRGRLLRDNVYGTIDQDVWRRDFTCNALYYNIEDFSIWDYVGGVDDIRARTLRLIGDPETRYREDPVRMLRAVRFEAKLGFSLHESTRAPFATLAGLLEHIPPARLLDEFQKLFLAGFGGRSFDLLRQHGLLEHLFPATAAQLATEGDGVSLRLIRAGLANTDRRVAEDRPVTPMFLFAVLLFGPVSAAAQRRFESGMHPGAAIADAVDEVVVAQNRRIGIPEALFDPDARVAGPSAAISSSRGPARARLPRAPAVPRGIRLPPATRGGRRRGSGDRALVDGDPGAAAGAAAASRRERTPAMAGRVPAIGAGAGVAAAADARPQTTES